MLLISRLRLPRSPNHARGLTALGLWASRGLGLAWAAAWIAFTASVVWGQPLGQTLIGTASGAVILVPVLVAWAFPRFGGMVLLGLAVIAYSWAESEAARLGIALPALGLGSAFFVLGSGAGWQRWRTRRKALKIARRLEREPEQGASA